MIRGGAGDGDKERACHRGEQHRNGKGHVAAGSEVADLHAVPVLENEHQKQHDHRTDAIKTIRNDPTRERRISR